MDLRIRLISAAAAMLIVCRAADPGQATVVLDGSAVAGHPVQAGVHPAPDTPPFGIQYTITGGFQPQFPWFSPCPIWPWSTFNPFWQGRGNAARTISTVALGHGGPFIPVSARVP